MLYRYFRKIETGQWINVLFTVNGEEFSIPAESHRGEIASALGVSPEELETAESDSDGRSGTLLDLPVVPIGPPSTSRGRIVELLEIPRSDWTTAQFRELLQMIINEGLA